MSLASGLICTHSRWREIEGGKEEGRENQSLPLLGHKDRASTKEGTRTGLRGHGDP